MKPFPTHKPWSGGSMENWFPPFARRWSRCVRPLKLVPTPATLLLTVADVTVGSGAVGRLAGCVERLRLTTCRKWPPAPVEGCWRIRAASPERKPSGKCKPSAPCADPDGNDTTRDELIVRTSPVSEVAAAAICSPPPTTIVAASATRRALFRLIHPPPFPAC